MARNPRSSDDFDPAESTDNVPLDDSPMMWGIEIDNASTHAVKTPGPETIVASWHGANAIISVPTPGPVTMTVSWKPETKVVGPAVEVEIVEPSPIAEVK